MAKKISNVFIISLFDQSVVSISNFMTGVIIGRACTKEQFGLYMLGLTLILFANTSQGGIITTPYAIYSAKLKDNDYNRYLTSSLVHMIALNVVFLLILSGAGVLISSGFGPIDSLVVIQSLIFVIFFILLKEFIRCVYFSALKVQIALVFDLLVAVIQISGLLLLAHLGVLSSSRAFLIIGTACGVVSICSLIFLRGHFNFKVGQVFTDFQKNWSMGKWVFASGCLWSVSTRLYPWIIATLHGPAATGLWAACSGILGTFNPVIGGVQNVITPKMAHIYNEDGKWGLRQFSTKVTIFLFAIMLVFCLFIVFFGDSLLSFVYGDKYAGNGMLLTLLSLNLLLLVTAFAFSRALFVVERANIDFKINFFSLFVMFTIGVWLTDNYGEIGAAYGLLISNFGNLILRMGMFSRVMNQLS